MEHYFILILVGFTSVGAYVVGARGLGLPGSGLRTAVTGMLERVGLTLVFFVLNVTTGMVAILATRLLTGEFVSLYAAGDETLLGLSLLQGLTFQGWRERSRNFLRE